MALNKLYSTLIGRKYKSLSDDEKRIVYANEIWKDSGNEEVATDIIMKAPSSEFVDDQLRNTFEYTDETIII